MVPPYHKRFNMPIGKELGLDDQFVSGEDRTNSTSKVSGCAYKADLPSHIQWNHKIFTGKHCGADGYNCVCAKTAGYASRSLRSVDSMVRLLRTLGVAGKSDQVLALTALRCSRSSQGCNRGRLSSKRDPFAQAATAHSLYLHSRFSPFIGSLFLCVPHHYGQSNYFHDSESY